MADEQVTVSPPVVETPPAPVQQVPPPVQDALDETGVPYRNRVAEYKRKLEEQEALNRQYQMALGAQQQQHQTPPPQRRKPQEMFDEETLTGINLLVEQKANEIMHRAQISQQLNDPELNTAARDAYAGVSTNPMYADWPETAKQSFAVAQARATLLERKAQTATQANTNQVLNDAARAQAAGASLPGTGGGGPQNPTEAKDAFVRKFMADDTQRTMVREYWDTDPDSEEGQKHLKRAAERAFGGAQFSSSKVVNEVIKQMRANEGGGR